MTLYFNSKTVTVPFFVVGQTAPANLAEALPPGPVVKSITPTSHPDWYERYAYVEDGILCWGARLKVEHRPVKSVREVHPTATGITSRTETKTPHRWLVPDWVKEALNG